MAHSVPAFVRVENYQGLIAQIAIKHWRRLPPSYKSWMDVEDLIADGLLFARFKVLPYYDFQKGSFTTILTTMLNQHLSRKVGEALRFKRMPVEVPLPYRPDGAYVVTSKLAMKTLYKEASPLLRKQLKLWFGKSGPDVTCCNSVSFGVARKEFLALAKRFDIDVKACRILLERRKLSAIS